jgi:hypothetical protein
MTLKQILKTFEEEQKKLDGSDKDAKIQALAELFKPIAKHLLCEGCFEVYSGQILIRRVFPYTVEFYYHEEEGDVKDPIVYHKNKSDYFESGTINAHQSGIDITFENKDAKYRASALIRAFRVKEGDNMNADFKNDYQRTTSAKSKDVEYRSTYIYDYLFTNIPLPITVQWKPLETAFPEDPIQGYRVNVYEYKTNDSGVLENSEDLDRKPWAFSLEEFPVKYRLP